MVPITPPMAPPIAAPGRAPERTADDGAGPAQDALVAAVALGVDHGRPVVTGHRLVGADRAGGEHQGDRSCAAGREQPVVQPAHLEVGAGGHGPLRLAVRGTSRGLRTDLVDLAEHVSLGLRQQAELAEPVERQPGGDVTVPLGLAHQPTRLRQRRVLQVRDPDPCPVRELRHRDPLRCDRVVPDGRRLSPEEVASERRIHPAAGAARRSLLLPSALPGRLAFGHGCRRRDLDRDQGPTGHGGRVRERPGERASVVRETSPR